MAEFDGGKVVFVPMPVTPEMVVWALPGPSGDIPYDDVEALVNAEFDERIDQMEQIEQGVSDDREHIDLVLPQIQGHADTASTAATAAGDAQTAAETAKGLAEGYALDALGSAGDAKDDADRAQSYAENFNLTVDGETGAPGSQVEITVTRDGASYDLSFTIPQGAKGEQGDPGEISQAQLDAAVASLVDNAPEALDTLHELADALGNDPNFATTVSTQIGQRALIDGAPTEYNTLGKLVTALQNHELGGSTDASLLEGSLTDQVDLSSATVLPVFDGAVTRSLDELIGELAEFVVQYLFTVGTGPELKTTLDNKADTDHTHTVADIEATGTANSSTFLRGDETWADPLPIEASVAETQAGTETAVRSWSPARVRQTAIGALASREWIGSQAAYDALGSYHPTTTYYVLEE